MSRWRRIRSHCRSHREHLTPRRRRRTPTLPKRSRWRGIGVHVERNRHNSYSESIESNPPVKGARAFALEPPKTLGTHQLHNGSLIVEVENASRDRTRSITAETDETIQILRGNLTLKAADKSEIFKPGDIVILPKGLDAEMQVSAGYRAIIVRAR